MSEENPCKPFNEKKIKAHELSVDINGHVHNIYYTKEGPDNIQIFHYNDQIKGYIPMNADNPIYPDLIYKILNL